MEAANVEPQGAGAPSPPQIPDVGATLGPYRLLRRLGAGTTGTVFEVEHQRIARRAAMKVLSPMVAVPNVQDRFVVEAQAVNAIRNPHVVEITDILESADGRPLALVMELLEGDLLGDVLARQRVLPIDRVLHILAGVCEALAAVHDAGFVHRDLKPENIFLIQRDGDPDFVKLLDFGLVKPVGEGGARGVCATVEGTFLGSPAYASPEQAAGKNVDRRTDIYSLGVMAYELLTGELPFMADGFREVLMKHMTVPAPHLAPELAATDLGGALDELLQVCLAKNPDHRLFSARQLAQTFRQMAGADGPAPDMPPRRRGAKRVGRRGRALAASVAVGVVALGLALRHRGAPSAPAAPPAPAMAAAAVLAPSIARAAEPVPHAAGALAEAQRDPPRRANRLRRAPRNPRPLDEATTLDPFQ